MHVFHLRERWSDKNGETHSKEERLIKKYNLPESLIVRTLKEE
jgi:hypothetical protein